MDTSTQCACSNCICPVSAATAVVVEGKLYCSETCAQGHPDGHHGCGHTGCHC
ncbi:MAG: metallothionein [Gloeomargaritaceae cyanobacterium C42_A2020_066]|nr:metallothionein [Gloeomargaritaceae cyanobacterium C42_A2020_066]